jgi:hypothetical protein
MQANFSRRQFTAMLIAAMAAPVLGSDSDRPAGHKLNFEIENEFGGASIADIEKVIRSAADSIWRHCPHTRWELPGFYIYHSTESPITLNDHRPDGRIAIGLTAQGTYWAQFAFQFAHEFCHALAGHSNDWHKPLIRGRKPNHWLEESLCEMASLFALRSMAKSWEDAPPYPNWKSFAPHLSEYAADRIEQSRKELPADESFTNWLAINEPAMRKNPVLREKNEVVAVRLLPLFESTPSGWESVTFYNLARLNPNQSLSQRLAEWREAVPEGLKPFVNEIKTKLAG